MYSRDHTLSPLPSVLRHGLGAVTVLASISLVASFSLLVYLFGRLAVWYSRSRPQDPERRTGPAADAVAGLPRELGEQYFGPGHGSEDARERCRRHHRRAPNQALVLVLNVLLADVLQACAFFLNVVWLAEDRITDESPACFAQGWLISTGDLASAIFIATIAVHTYVSLVRGYTLSCRVFYGIISFLWLFVLLMSVLGVIISKNGAEYGGFYVRDVSWCWINYEYEAMRVYLHYIWMTILIVVGTVAYVLTFIHFYRAGKAAREPHAPAKSADEGSNSSVLSPTSMATPSPQPEEENRSEVRKRLIFLLYPLIFVVCTAPLAVGRMVSSAGVRLSPEYLCFAGAMITSNGWLDVLVFSTTRRAILFDASVDEQSIGIETFNLTPLGQQFGHRVWITAGGVRRQQQKRHERKPSVFRKASRHHRRRGSAEGSHDRSESQASLRGLEGAAIKGIQMETVTRIFVEVESPGEEKGYPAYPDRALSSMPSSETVGERVQQSMESYR
ncbi:integral membrane protein [Colletotrichum plurivorum]|uniref:Integral membrane protein n=1 Tax=Colletotrichum plurivorum TaxID=2175906 RepID=A0A8H6JUB8_9PEZI|nr:integral membrane protein [Colletotrichum plurivorum]